MISDVITAGRRIEDLSWLELLVFTLVPHPKSHLYALKEQQWDANTYLLAFILDAARLLVWFQTEDSVKNRNRPEPVRRPDMEAEQEKTVTTVAGSPRDVVNLNEMKKRLRGVQHA